MKKEIKKSAKTKKFVTKKSPEQKSVNRAIVQVPADNVANIPPKEMRGFARQMTPIMEGIMLPPRVVRQIADEVVDRLRMRRDETKKVPKKTKPAERAVFLDTSAILDERFFELLRLGVLYGTFIIIDPVLSELKHIADLKDDIKKERGKKSLKLLDQAKKLKDVKIMTIKDEEKADAVDDKIILAAKRYKGRIVTGDYNLSQKAKISDVISINLHEVANALKTQAIPGEEFWVKIIQAGKGEGQGVGYLPDGTMIVLENGLPLKGRTVKVTVSRIIQTEAGKILFSQLAADQTGVATF